MQLTANQENVLAALQQANCPLSAYALLEQLRKRGFNSPVQVYRALRKLVEHGLVQRLETLNAYVTCSQPNHCENGFTAFAICDTCGHAEQLAVDDISINLSLKEHGFSVETSVIEVSGQCATCSRRVKSES